MRRLSCMFQNEAHKKVAKAKPVLTVTLPVTAAKVLPALNPGEARNPASQTATSNQNEMLENELPTDELR